MIPGSQRIMKMGLRGINSLRLFSGELVVSIRRRAPSSFIGRQGHGRPRSAGRGPASSRTPSPPRWNCLSTSASKSRMQSSTSCSHFRLLTSLILVPEVERGIRNHPYAGLIKYSLRTRRSVRCAQEIYVGTDIACSGEGPSLLAHFCPSEQSRFTF